MSKTLTSREAYLAMFSFLETIFQRTESEDLGVLLGSMSLLKDGQPADPAILEDWETAIQKANLGIVRAALDLSRDERKSHHQF